ncbi:MAG: PAS domain S-box protein, partial [Myxococcota bacterium]
GYRRDELPSYDRFLPWLLEQTHPDDRERLTQTYRDFVEGRAQLYEVEVRLRHRAGHWVWVRGISKALQRDADGRVLHLLGMMLDVTDLKRTQEELRESETRFRGLADSLPNMVWVHDATGQQEYVNATFCSFFGVEREEMKGGRWQLLMHPEDADAYNRKFLACVDAKRPFHAEARVRHADGTWRRIESWARPRLTREGEYLGFVGTSVDVTERWHMESALRDEKERFRTLADNMAQLAWMADGEGWIFWYNKRWFDYTGTTFHEMQGWGWKKAHHPEHVARVVEKISRHFASGEVWEDVFPLRRADGAYRWFLSRALPIRNAHGKVVRWFGTHTDITDQREIEQKLIHADRQKDVFLAMLGHELRNPLAAVSSATELLSLADDASPELVHTRGVLERQTGHMAKLLDGLLDVSRFIWGKIELETCQMDLAEVSRQTVADVLSQRKEEEIDVRVEVPAEPVWIQGDPVRMRQVVDNLLTNACKYTPSGGRITMTLERVDEAAVLRVSDTGVGIEPDLLPHVFEVFRQSEQSFDRASGGLGLGLSLVKSLVELHGGSVEARSDGKDHGAEIIVRVPLAKEAQAPSRRPTLPPSGPLRILVIEDAVDVAEMMRLVLKNAGHDVVVAGDGVAGMAEAREHVPDVVLCDLGLPGALSGFDVAKALRDDDRLRESLLIAVSGYGRPDDKARGREAGFDLHLTKPVDFKSLLSLLANRAD